MKQIEVVARSQEQAIRKAAANLKLAEGDLHVIEEYEPDEIDLQKLKDEEAAEDIESPEGDAVLYILSVDAAKFVEPVREWVQGLLDRFRPGSQVEVVAENNGLTAVITAEDASIFIGRQGQTLQALQHIVTRGLNQRVPNCPPTTVDIGQYREKRVEQLTKVAKSAAERAARTNRNVELRPMSAEDRKFIHNFLKNWQGITTTSHGKDPRRFVVVEVPGGEGKRPARSGGDREGRDGRGGARGGRGGNRERGGHRDGNRGNYEPGLTHERGYGGDRYFGQTPTGGGGGERRGGGGNRRGGSHGGGRDGNRGGGNRDGNRQAPPPRRTPRGDEQPFVPGQPEYRWEGSLPKNPPKKKSIEEALQSQVGGVGSLDGEGQERARRSEPLPEYDRAAPLADELED